MTIRLKTLRPRGWETFFALLIASMLGRYPGQANGDSQRAAQSHEIRLRSQEALEVLEGSNAEERRRTAESACSEFEVLDPIMDDGSRSTDVVERLRRYLRHERDDWIATLFLDSIDCHRPLVRSLFLDALASSSPNRRWRAFRWFKEVEDPAALPLLENAWVSETRPWARADLVKALSRNHSRQFLEDFLDLAEAEDAYQASAAIGALKAAADDRSIPVLAQLAEDSENWRRKEAAEALEEWPDSAEALSSLLRTSDADEPEVRACTLRSLSRMSDPSGMVRVLVIALTDEDSEVRRRAVAALNSSPWCEVANRLLRDSSEMPNASQAELEEFFTATIDSLQRGKKEQSTTLVPTEKSTEREPRCTFYRHEGGLDPENPDARRASPSPGMSSARCFVRPGVAGDPRILGRVPRGSLLFIYDHFESSGEPWVQVHGFRTSNPCWLPATQVVSATEEDPQEEEEGILERDFDIRPDAVWGADLVEMREAGMLKVIEPGEELVGVALRAHMGDPREEELLRHAFSSAEILLSTNVFWMIEEAYTRICDYPSMIELARGLGWPVRYCPDSPPSTGNPEVEPDTSADL